MSDDSRAATVARRELGGVFGNYVSLLGLNAFALLLSFASTWLLTRSLGPTGYGEWSVIMAVVMAGIAIGTNGTLTSLVRFGNEEYLLEGAIRRVFWGRTILLVVTLLLVGLVLWLADLLWADSLQALHVAWWVVFAAIAASSFSLHSQHALQGAKRLRAVGLTQTLERVVLLAAVSGLAALGLLSVPALAVAFIASGTVGGLALIFLLPRGLWLPPATDRGTVGSLLSFSAPYFLLYSFSFLSTGYLDVLILKSFVSTQDVGLYAFAVQLIGVLLQVSTVAGVVLLPTMTSALVLGRSEMITLYIRHLLPAIAFLWSLVLALGIVLAPVVIPLVFGTRFSPAVAPFSIMLAACAFAILSQAGYSPAVNAYKWTWLNARVGIVSGFVNLLLDLLLIPPLGIAGAALATVAAYFTTTLLFIVFAGPKLAVKRDLAPLLCTLPLLVALVSVVYLGQPLWGALAVVVTSTALVRVLRLFDAEARQAFSLLKAQRGSVPAAEPQLLPGRTG